MSIHQEPNHCPTFRCGRSLPDSHVLDLTWCLSKFIYFHTRKASLFGHFSYLFGHVDFNPEKRRQRTKLLNPAAFRCARQQKAIILFSKRNFGQACLSFPLAFLCFIGDAIRCFTSVRNLRKDASCVHRGRTSCLYAGGTLATRLNSNYACMGLPPDDMIGF